MSDYPLSLWERAGVRGSGPGSYLGEDDIECFGDACGREMGGFRMCRDILGQLDEVTEFLRQLEAAL